MEFTITRKGRNLYLFRQRVEKLGGADYLQVFKNSKGETIFVIDQLNKEMKEENSDEFVKENDYFTILFSYEY